MLEMNLKCECLNIYLILIDCILKGCGWYSIDLHHRHHGGPASVTEMNHNKVES